VEVVGKRITKYGLALLAIVLIGLFLRLYHVGTQSIWLDEAYSIVLSKMSLSQIMQATGADVHPPLYYFILHYWVALFGASAVAVRLLSVLFGVLTIPMVYLVGRQLFNKEAGLVGALILALSWFNIFYSQEARMYSLTVLLALISVYFFLRLLHRSTLASSAGYVLSTTLLLYTHYYGVFVLFAENTYLITLLVLSKHRTCKLRHWVVLQAIVLALFVPWITFLSTQFLRREATGTWLAQPTTATIINTFVSYSGGTVLLALFLGLSVLSLFAYQKVRGAMDWKAPLKSLESYLWEVRLHDLAPAYFLVVLLLATNLIPFIVSLFRAPIYLDKYAIASSVALYLLVAKGISNINYRYAKIAVVGIIVVLSVANLPWYYTSIIKPQAQEATSFIDANAKSGDVVLIYPDWEALTFNYYNNRTDVAVKQIYYGNGSVNNPEATTEALQSDVIGHDRVWFYGATGLGTSMENFTLNSLNESYAKIYVKNYVGYNMYLYEKRA